MAKKNFQNSGLVYSTDKNLKFTEETREIEFVSPEVQNLLVEIDKKHRSGKTVTVVSGYRGNDIEDIGKQLKIYCGTGGAVKDGLIMVQGDNRDKIILWLGKKGFKNIKKR